jgi:hypothetical protein
MSGTRIGKLKGIWEIYFPVTLVAHLPLTYNGISGRAFLTEKSNFEEYIFDGH